jgi:hypothetical protein
VHTISACAVVPARTTNFFALSRAASHREVLSVAVTARRAVYSNFELSAL